MSDRGDVDNDVKICLVGNTEVGKSCLAIRLARDTFSEQETSTIGCAFVNKKLVVNDEVFNLNIWDTAGQERFRALGPLHYRSTSAIILVYDVTNSTSFECIDTMWAPEIRAWADEGVLLALVGNKLDLCDSQGRAVAMETARAYAHRLQAIHMETSAKTGHNVEAVFTEVVLRLRKMRNASAERDRDENVITLHYSSDANKGEPKRRCQCSI